MEQQQTSALQQEDIPSTDPIQGEFPRTDAMTLTSSNPEVRRSSTLNLPEEEDARETVLSALESILGVITTSESQFPELRDGTELEPINVSDAPSRTDDDNVSSVCDAPALPGGALRVPFSSGQINPVS